MEEKDPLAMDLLEKVMLDRLEKFTYISSFLSKDENIGFDGYIGTWILWIYRLYRKYIGNYFYITIDI